MSLLHWHAEWVKIRDLTERILIHALGIVRMALLCNLTQLCDGFQFFCLMCGLIRYTLSRKEVITH